MKILRTIKIVVNKMEIGAEIFDTPTGMVSFSLYAIKYTQTGIASTIVSIVPILLIPPAVLIYKQKVTWLEALGALISVLGVSLFFI
jgi:drug/metabolite transporter (DMT)-like permease